MPTRRASNVETFKALAKELGVGPLADMEAHLARSRPVPPRLIARLFRDDDIETVLTQRQREIMVLLASGHRRAEIADELGIGFETVKTHLAHAYQRLGVSRQIDAINAFLEEAA